MQWTTGNKISTQLMFSKDKLSELNTSPLLMSTPFKVTPTWDKSEGHISWSFLTLFLTLSYKFFDRSLDKSSSVLYG